MKKTKSWLILTFVLYLVFLFWSLPADYVLSVLVKRNVLPVDKILISGVDGSWARGRIQAVEIAEIKLNDLSWRFQPGALVFGRLQFALDCEVANGTVHGVLSLGSDVIELKQLQGDIAVASLVELYLPGLEVTGVLKITDLGLTMRGGYLDGGSGQISWLNGAVNVPYQMALGDSTLDLSTENGGVIFKLSQQGGALKTSGVGFLTGAGAYSFDGTISAQPGSSKELTPLFQFIGRPDPAGRIKIDYKGQMARLY